jgi:trans-aconitate 2-methyltransferase
MADWQPSQYLQFADERTRPARDLLSTVRLANPRIIYDLGSGPGNSTAVLAGRYPEAEIIGIDNSEAMLAEARKAHPALRFEHGDLASWQPQGEPDLLFSNATFQWLPDQMEILARLLKGLKPAATLAVQMPDNLNEPSHRLMQNVAEQGSWRAKLAKALSARAVLPTPQAYYELLKPYASRLDIWHTIYNHPLDGAEGIIQWVKGTGLRPYLDPLDDDERQHFLAEYTTRIAKAYPTASDGKSLLRFPRLFIVAER